MKPSKISKISPALMRWAETASPGKRRTVVIRLTFSADIPFVQETLEGYGVEIESSGPGVIIAALSPELLNQVSRLSFVMAIAEPELLHSAF